MGAVIRYLDFKKDEQELHVTVPDVPNHKQSTAWINALQKVFMFHTKFLIWFILFCILNYIF